MPSIVSASSQPISGFSGLPKLRQSVKPSGSPPTHATLRAASRTASWPPTRGSSEPMRACPSSVRARPRRRRPQTEDGRVEPRPADGARLDELVVAARDEGPRAELRRGEELEQRRTRVRHRRRTLGRRDARLALDRVARALVGEESGGDRPDLVVVPERAQQPGLGHLADHGAVELPAVDHRLDLGEPLGGDDRDHPLLRLGDHHLPRLHPLLALRHAVEVDVDAVVGRHLRERRGETGGAAVLEREHEPALDELDRDLDQPLPGERVADLHRGALVRVVLAELRAREHRRAADPVAPGRRAVEDDERARACRLRAREPLGGKQPTHIALTRQFDAYASSNTTSPPTFGTPTQLPYWPIPPTAREKWSSGAPKRRPSSSAIGRAPIAEMSRRIPPTPVAAPWNGSTADGWLWLSTLNATASPSPRSSDARVLARPLEHARPVAREPPQQQRRVLVAAVLRPEQREDGQLEVVRLAPQQRDDAVELPVREAELAMERLFRDGAQETSLAGRLRRPPVASASTVGRHVSRRDLGLLLLLSAIWGSSFLFIKLGVDELEPSSSSSGGPSSARSCSCRSLVGRGGLGALRGHLRPLVAARSAQQRAARSGCSASPRRRSTPG